MRRPHARSLSAVTAAVGMSLLLLLPMGATAGAPSKGTDHFVELFCDGVTSDDGTLFFGVSISDLDGVGANLEGFGPDAIPFVDPPSFVGNFDEPATASYVGGEFTADIPVLDDSGNPAGSAAIEATLVEAGSAEPINDRFRDGNRSFRSKGTFLPLAVVSGTATLPDGSSFALEAGACFSGDVHVTFFGSNPTSFVRSFSSSQVSCPLLDGGEVVGNLFVDVDPDRTFAFVDATFFEDMSGVFGAFADVEIVSGQVSTALDYFVFETGEEVGPGSIEMTLAATGERFSYTLDGGTFVLRVHGEVYDVEGTLTAPGFEPFDLGDCMLADASEKEIQRATKRPRPTGRAPANDVPSGARRVAPGTNLSQQTKNAAFDMEEPFECVNFVDEEGNPFTTPVLKTVWFKLQGAGAPVTLNTKGSGFDTVMAVYEKADDGTFVPVPDACVDDVPVQPLGRTLQAALTFHAEAGTTYYVQIGGFPDDLNWGSLHLRVR